MPRLKTLLSIATLILGIPLLGQAGTYGPLTYTSNTEVTITDCNRSASGHLEIPATIEGLPVTIIGDNAIQDCSSLTSITIPDSVTSIGDVAFYNCPSLTSITLGNSVTTIGSSAFRYCTSLTSITIPDSATSIGDLAFDACNSLTNVTFLGAPPTVGSSAFPTTNFKARAGFGSTLLGKAVTQEMRIKSTTMDASNNLRIETDALNTTGLKVFHTTSLNSPFTEVTGVTKEGEGTVTIPAGNAAAQGTSGFYKVIYQE